MRTKTVFMTILKPTKMLSYWSLSVSVLVDSILASTGIYVKALDRDLF